MSGNKYVNFNSKDELDVASYNNRINNLDTYEEYIYNNILHKNGFIPSDDIRKFLRLKIKDATESLNKDLNLKESLKPSTHKLLNNDSMVRSMETLKVLNYIQLFLDKYMSPVDSDVLYRLGEVTATKNFQIDAENRTVIYDDNAKNLDILAQYDKYGRMDTSSNFRCLFHIDGTASNVIPSYDEYYVNWFFPPFDNKGFLKENGATEEFLDEYNIVNDKTSWNGKRWNYYNKNSDKLTFDKDNILCLRDNPTYRGIAYKPLNDNISFLQYIFEQCTGIVSTYLTEWDLSLYIQEGLLSKKYNNRNSFISLNNRIFHDNPVGYTDESALSFGILNAAVSKTPFEGGISSNTSPYIPYAYPLSIYWWNYESINRGDGLDKFYDTALAGFDEAYFKSLPFKDKVKWYDEVGAAYSGWKNWDNLQNYQALYTCYDDGLSDIDLIHMNECTEDMTFNSIPEEDSKGEIEQIIDSLYGDDESLGFPPDEWDDEVEWRDGDNYYKLAKHYKRDTTTGDAIFMYAVKSCINKPDEKPKYYDSLDDLREGKVSEVSRDSIDIGIEGDIRILGIRIPGSGLLRTFLKRGKIKDRVMAIADKAKNGYTDATASMNRQVEDASGTTNSGAKPDDSFDLSNELANMLGSNLMEPSRYSRQDGVSQWSPMLYGGPHGRYYSPKTVQGLFETDNPFLRNIPRLYNSSLRYNDFFPRYEDEFFENVESCYNLYNHSDGRYDNLENPSRSPSKCMSLLNKGYFNYTMYPVDCYKKFDVYISVEGTYDSSTGQYTYNRPTYYNGHYLYYNSDRYYEESYESNTYHISPYSLACMDYNICSHVYSDGWYEWDNYYSYMKSNEYYYKSYYGREKRFKSRWFSWIPIYVNKYMLKKVTYNRGFSAYYYAWTTIYYKRPLMHSNPNDYWSISRTNKYTISTTRVSNFWKSAWLNFCAFWSGARYVESSYLVYKMNPPEEVFRLVFPKSPVAIYREVKQIGSDNNCPYIISRAEKDFMENVLNNTQKESHKVIFFASNNSESYRDKYGPDLIFSAECYLDTYNYKYRTQYWYKYRHKCHADWAWEWRENVATGNYICVDINKSNISDVLLSGMKPDAGNPFSNLSITKTLSSTDNYMDRDVPPDNSRTTLYTTPISFEMPIPKSDCVDFAGFPRNNTTEQGFHGWGYTTAIPGFQPRFEYTEGNSFENPDEYLNIRYKYRHIDNYGGGLKNYSFNSLITPKFFPFYHLSANAPAIYPSDVRDDNIIYMCGVRSYVQWDNSPKIKGLMVALKNCFTTSTFFKDEGTYSDPDLEKRLRPCIVTNDCMLRTAVRIALHQKSFLKQAKAILEDNLDFESIKSIIENRIDKEILDKTIRTETKDTQSIFYHYWLDKAYTEFSDINNKEAYKTKFDEKISYLDTFINNSQRLINKEIGMWSYNDFVKSLDNTSILQNDFLITEKESKLGDSVYDFMYMYLNVLYEFRKFFINKRCNKIDGTLWTLRSLESAIPMVSEIVEDPNDKPNLNPPSSGISQTIRYKVDFYKSTNGSASKVSAALNSESINDSKTSTIFIKVNYVTDIEAKEYLKGIKDGTWNESVKGRYVYIKQNQRWAELPFDEEYRYISKEYTKTLADIKYNENAVEIAKRNNKTPKLRPINKLVDGVSNDKCVFNIKWTTSGGLNTISKNLENNKKYFKKDGASVTFENTALNGYKELNKSNFLDLTNNYPYTYEGDNETKPYIWEDCSVPSILFDVNNGIDVSKVEALVKAGVKVFDNAPETLCHIRNTNDYWCIKIPESARPLTEGYKKGLYIRNESTYTVPDVPVYPNGTTSAMGSFGYALYPITEEQANILPGIEVGMENISVSLKNKLLNDSNNKENK